MWNKPKSRKEAQKRRYNVWGGNPGGNAYDPERCAEEVHDRDRGALAHQCSKKPGHGPDGIYCSTHSPEAEARREAKATARYEAEQAVWRRREQRAIDREAFEEILIEIADWLAANRELVAADEWLFSISEKIAWNDTLLAAINNPARKPRRKVR